jgi:hypothetical protein
MTSKDDWPFSEPENVAVFTSTKVLRLGQPILRVSHDEEDGAWQFHADAQPSIAEVMVVGLSEIAEHDRTVCELADLPCGWCAEREAVGMPWRRAPGDGER